ARELDGVRAHPYRALRRRRLQQIAVRLHLGVVRELERRLERPPDALRGAQPLLPLDARPGGEVRGQVVADRRRLLPPRLGGRIALEQVAPIDRGGEDGPEALRLHPHQPQPLAPPPHPRPTPPLSPTPPPPP